jgi:hypothetical protein
MKKRTMKHTYITLAAALLLAALCRTASAQSDALIHHTIVKMRNNPPPEGRDFWFAMMSNYWGEDLGGKYMRIYFTAAKNCVAFVASNGNVTPVPVKAYQISYFHIPEFWEMESSGIVENKAIHVYSNTADLTVYDMSHEPYSSDGSYIIPTIGWGTDYVVAAYGSLFDGAGTYIYDLPSTLAIVADQDNTTVTITPSCDCRQCTGGNDAGDANSTIVVYPNGVPVQFHLNRGQSLQMMPVKPTDTANFDLTGTIIHSNQPIGVSGGSVCTNIPSDFPYCDHVEDMMPPVRTWGETYYATNNIQPAGVSGHDFARYLFISSQPNQTIYRYDWTTGQHTECIIKNQYGIYWDELEGAQEFTSTAPFLVVSYMNSSTYPDGKNGLGDPAECIIPPKDHYSHAIVFETPLSIGNIVPYDNYANIICRDSDAKYTLFDGKGILGLGAQPIDGTFEIFNVPHIAPGAHTAVQDTNYDPRAAGIGLYLYGYGYDESYAWTGSFGTATFHSPDTVAPKVDTTGRCYTAYIHVSDSGFLPNDSTKQSALSEIRLDSVYNMSYIPDPNFIEGAGQDSSDYVMYVVDPTKPAILVIEVYDIAGNETKITSVYEPLEFIMEPPVQNLGVWGTGVAPNVAYDTIYNLGAVPLTLNELHLLYGNVGFSIYDSVGRPLDLSPLQPGQRRIIQIQFEALVSTRAVDSIIYGNTCDYQSVAVIGGGGTPDFIVTDQTWPHELLTKPRTCYPKTVTIENLTKSAITIDSGWWPDTVHFHADPVNHFPFTVPAAPGNATFIIDYCPDSSSLFSPNRTAGNWISPQVLKMDGKTQDPRIDSLIGWAIAPSQTFIGDSTVIIDCAQTNDTITGLFTITATGTYPTTINRVFQTDSIDFFNLGGTLDNGITWDPTKTAQQIDTGQTATISVQYVVKGKMSDSDVDHLYAFDGNNDIIGDTLGITIISNYASGVTNDSAQIAPVLFQERGVHATTFSIQNTSNSPLEIDNILLYPSAFDSAFSFTFAEIPPTIPVTFPTTLPVGESLLVTVNFNDSLYDVRVQTAQFEIVTNSCTPITETVTATISNASVKETSTPSLDATILPTEDGHSLVVTVPSGTIGPLHFELVNVLGESVQQALLGNGTQTLDESALPRGVYFYRLTSGSLSQSGKIILGE